MQEGRQGFSIFARDGTPVAYGVRLGGLFFSSSLEGRDPETGQLGPDAERQFALAFRNLRALVVSAGLGLDQVAHVTVFIKDASFRPLINGPWLELFPEQGRPARKTTHTELPPDVLGQLQVFGATDGPREPLEIPGLAHRDPLPMGAKIGPLVFSSVLGGDDPKTGQRPEGEDQIRQAFANLRTLVEQAGGTTEDILQVWAYLGDFAYQPALVRTWLEFFPEDGNRPARKTIAYDLGGRVTLIQLQTIAVLGGHRENFEIPGIGHHDPIPLAARKGNILCSSGIDGRDPETGELASGPEAQAEQGFRNARTLMELAGGTLDHVGHVTAMVGDLAHGPAVVEAWKKTFPEEGRRPALHVLPLGVAGREALVQLHFIGVF